MLAYVPSDQGLVEIITALENVEEEEDINYIFHIKVVLCFVFFVFLY